MVPLLLKPILVDELWGGERLYSEFSVCAEAQRVASAYMLSDMRNLKITVKTGEFAGKTLHSVIKQMGISALGSKGRDLKYVPFNVKLLDVKERLSVQVCPDDEYALSHDGAKSGVKLWYIVDCNEDSQLVYGFKYPTDPAEVEHRINNGSLSEICNTITPKKGDIYLINTGTVHTAGKGLIIAEIRFGTDLSYRLTDYGRTTANGRPRTVRMRDAMNVLNTSPTAVPEVNPDTTLFPFGTVKTVAKTEDFTTELLCLNGNAGLCEAESFTSMLVTEGEAIMSYVGGTMRIKKGDSVFLPANVRVIISGRADILCTRL